MNGRAHRAVAVATWLAAAPHLGVTHPGHLTAGTAIALACGHGHLSPGVTRQSGEYAQGAGGGVTLRPAPHTP